MPTKKTTKKIAAKKPTKSAARKSAKVTKKPPVKKSSRVLVCASDDRCFWTSDGKILRDLEELADALHGMEDEIFAHHVTKDKNDFANWVEDVLLDDDCAEALRKARKSSTAQKVVIKQLKLYSK